MHKWSCPYCGEEMLGSVNRCWSCGKRIDPPSLEAIVVADVVETTADREEEPVAVAAEEWLLTADDVARAFDKQPPRRGSPFARMAEIGEQNPFVPRYGEGPYTRAMASEIKGPRPALAAQYPRHTAAHGAVVAALVLGIVSLVLIPFTVLTFFTALVGIFFGIWGLKADKKGLATAALLVCALAVMLTGVFFAFQVYGYMTGVRMFGGGGW